MARLKVRYFIPVYAIDCKDKYSEILDCNCKLQLCKGKYIKTREGQTTCLFDHLEKLKNML